MTDFNYSGNNFERGKTVWRLARLQFVNHALDWLIGLFRLTVSEQKDAGIYLDPYSHPEYVVRLADQHFDRDN